MMGRVLLAAMFVIGLASGAFAKGTNLIFVSLERGNQVVVLNPDLTVKTKIDTSRRPRDLHFNKDHSLLYVACGDDDTIDVIDVAKLAVVDSIPTGPSPEMFRFSPDESQIFVSNEEDSVMEMIDVASKTVVQRVATGGEPEGVINSVDGKYIFVTSEVAGMVHVIDRAKAAVVKNIIVGTRPRRFVVTPDGSELWVSNELSSEVHVIDIASLKIKDDLTFVPPGFRPEDVTPVGMIITKDGSKVLITLGRSNHLAIVDAKTRKVLQYVLVGSRAWDVDLTSDEKTAFVTNGLSDDITEVDMASMAPVRSLPVGRTPHSVRVDD
jgi:PQQ-dependent catabolism-associated beta-propeller protein